MTLYLDSSALVKAVVDEPESMAVRRLLADGDDVVSSSLLDVEVARVMNRLGRPAGDGERLIATVRRIDISRGIIAVAAQAAPGIALGSLDAIHLATALAIPEAVTMITYDRQLARGCAVSGIPVLAPA